MHCYYPGLWKGGWGGFALGSSCQKDVLTQAASGRREHRASVLGQWQSITMPEQVDTLMSTSQLPWYHVSDSFWYQLLQGRKTSPLKITSDGCGSTSRSDARMHRSSAKPCREGLGSETLGRHKRSCLGRNGVLWEHRDGYFPAAFSSCRKADLHQLHEHVGIPRSLSTGLGPCWPRGDKGWGPRELQVPVHRGSSWIYLEGGGRSSLGKASGEGSVGYKGWFPAPRTCP